MIRSVGRCEALNWLDLTDPNVSPEAKAHARHMLELHGIKL